MPNPLLEQIFKLLGTAAGSLTYHLVLAFSVAGALQVSFIYSQRSEPLRLKRTMFGLTVLLLLQFALFAFAGLAWQNLVDGAAWLPAIDRAVALVSLVVIIWLWCFPDPEPSADAGALLLGLFALTAALMGSLYWFNQGVRSDLNGSQPDLLVQGLSLTLLLVGALLLLARRPDFFGLGLAMLALLAVGSLLHLLAVPAGGSYPVVIRLAQMAAFPFLLVLPQRALVQLPIAAQPAEVPVVVLPASEQERLYSDPQLWLDLEKLASETDPVQTAKLITATLARSLQADLCVLLAPPDAAGKMQFSCVYDLTHGRFLEKNVIESRAAPMLTSSLKMGRVRRLPANSLLPDATGLARALEIEKTGSLLFLPVLATDGAPRFALILLSPFSGKEWSPDDQFFLSSLARLMAQFLQRSHEDQSLKEDTQQARLMARQAQDQIQQVVEERQKLRDQIAVMQENTRNDQVKIAGMAALAAAQAAAKARIDELHAENDSLKETLRQSEATTVNRIQPLEGELRMALEEIADLNQTLGETEQRIAALKFGQGGPTASAEQLQAIANIAQDLRQPLSSIVGYTDFLLGESVGILGSMQRKYLERTKISTERISRLVDDLSQAASLESSPAQLEIQEVDVCLVAREAVREAKSKFREKKLALQLELPAKPLTVSADQEVLRRVFSQLLYNAGAVTPAGGDVSFSAHLESSENEQDYVLVRVEDHGGGIAIQDLPRVFSPRQPGAPIAGVSENGTDLPGVRTLVEVLGGRTWVDSEPGLGATFSVLLPVHPVADSDGANGQESGG